jgi:signal transduction histidine kinase
MNKKSISDIVIDSLQLTYSRALICIAFIIFASTFFAWTLLIRPGYISLTETKDEARKVLSDRNIQLFVSEADQSVSNIGTLLRAAEGAIYAISSDMLSFKKDTAPSSVTLPTAKEFLAGGVYVRTVRQNRRNGGLSSYDYPQIYCSSAACYEKTNPELDFFSRYWPQFLGIAKKMYAIGPEIQWVYIASGSGMLTMYPALPAVPPGYDPRVRPWYKNTLKASDIVWTSPYFAAGGSDLVVTVSKRFDSVASLSKAVVAIDINLDNLISHRLSFPYCDQCRLMLASDSGDVIAERDMAKKGDWQKAPAPVKLDDVFSAMFKSPDARGITEKLYKKDVRTNLVSGTSYIFSLPISFLDWRLVGVIPLDYYGSDGSSIIQHLESIIRKTKRELLLVLGSVGIMVVLSLILFLALSKATIKSRLMPLLHQFVELSKMLKGSQATAGVFKNKDFQDVAGLSSEYEDITSAIMSYEKTIETQSRLTAISETARQVAHDIRSPLAALDCVMQDVSQLPEKRRDMMRSAAARIRDIANNLIEMNRTFQAAGTGAPAASPASTTPDGVQLLSSLLDPLVTEKRVQFQSKTGVEIDARLDEASYGLFAEIQPAEFKRVLSNLINNAVEALADKGAVTVSLAREDGKILLTVHDNGKGIAAEVLPRLGRKGETHGKAGGSGLGLYHAKTCVEAWGGALGIKSEPGQGTTVAIRLPQARPPAWFVSELEIKPGSAVVVFDDDPSIHQVWQGRFDSLRPKEHGISVFDFETPEQLRGWVSGRAPSADNVLFLMDYELRGHQDTGLSLAEELRIGERAILVTSRFEERRILEGCLRLKMRMIPKGMAGFVPISVEG